MVTSGGYDFYSDDADPYNPNPNAHGTKMTSIAAATINNGVNVSGVANVSYLAIKARQDDFAEGVVTSAAASGMLWCAHNGARVWSMSFGGTTNHTAFYDALEFAWYHRNAVLIGSSGNNYGHGLYYPGRYPFVISTTCVTAANLVCTNGMEMSSGDELDMSAPGQGIRYARPENTTGITTTGGASSEATAHVAGAAALLISRQPTLVNQVVKDLVEENAADIAVYGLGWDNRTGHGLLNVKAALDPLLPSSDPTCRFILPLKGATLGGTANLSAYAFSPGNAISSVNLSIDGLFDGGMSYHTSDIVNDGYFLGNHSYYRHVDTTTLLNGSHTFTILCRETDGSERSVSRAYPIHN